MDTTILDMVNDTAQDLHVAGVMKETMTILREFRCTLFSTRKRIQVRVDQVHLHKKIRQLECD